MEGYRMGIEPTGGGGAGHSIRVGEKLYKLKAIPASAITPGTISISDTGKVINPDQYMGDVNHLRSHGIDVYPGKNLLVSHLAIVTYSADIRMDELTGQRVGTTKSGTGPAYAGRMMRTGPVFRDLLMLDDPEVRERLRDDLKWKNAVIQAFGGAPIPEEEALAEFRRYAKIMEPFIADTEPIIREFLEGGGKAVGELTQSRGLRILSRSYPFNTAANTVMGAVNTDSGIPTTAVDRVISVEKGPYWTRVGQGEFLGEFGDYERVKAVESGGPVALTPGDMEAALGGNRHLIGRWLRNLGNERGTKTGRPRRTGQPHWGMVRDGNWQNGTTEHALTKMDVVFPGYEVVPIIGEKKDGVERDYIGAGASPVFLDRSFRWDTIGSDEERARLVEGGFEALAQGMREYAFAFSEFTRVPIRYITIGSDRTHTVTTGVFEATSEAIRSPALR